jgi:hypothetical protein
VSIEPIRPATCGCYGDVGSVTAHLRTTAARANRNQNRSSTHARPARLRDPMFSFSLQVYSLKMLSNQFFTLPP